jgi:acetoin utilization deacetylase AcuC-like enzyme
MMEMVLTLANGNVVCALEGGYTLETTAKGAVGCMGVLTVSIVISHNSPLRANLREKSRILFLRKRVF